MRMVSEVIRFLRFQPTRPRGARHGHAAATWTAAHVSTHAPTRGATRAQPDKYFIEIVSTHAPTRGATRNQGEG